VGPRGTGKTLLVQVPPAPLSTVPPATLPCLLTAHAVCLSMPLSVQLHGRATLGHVHVACLRAFVCSLSRSRRRGQAMAEEFGAALFAIGAQEVYAGGAGEGEERLRQLFRAAAAAPRAVILLKVCSLLCARAVCPVLVLRVCLCLCRCLVCRRLVWLGAGLRCHVSFAGTRPRCARPHCRPGLSPPPFRMAMEQARAFLPPAQCLHHTLSFYTRSRERV